MMTFPPHLHAWAYNLARILDHLSNHAAECEDTPACISLTLAAHHIRRTLPIVPNTGPLVSAINAADVVLQPASALAKEPLP